MTENTQLSVGMKLSLSINDNEEKHVLTLIGWEERNFIVTKNSLLKGLVISSKDDCVIRFVRNGVAYGFQTNMISMQYSPAPMIFFKYPEDIKSMTFRKSKRVRTNISAIILKQKDNQFVKFNVNIVDISDSGCLIEIEEAEMPDDINVGFTFFVNFKILDKSLELDCVARNVRNKNNVFLIGTQFINENDPYKNIISSFVNMIDTKDVRAV